MMGVPRWGQKKEGNRDITNVRDFRGENSGVTGTDPEDRKHTQHTRSGCTWGGGSRSRKSSGGWK